MPLCGGSARVSAVLAAAVARTTRRRLTPAPLLSQGEASADHGSPDSAATLGQGRHGEGWYAEQLAVSASGCQHGDDE